VPDPISVRCRKNRLPARRMMQRYGTEKCARAMEKLLDGKCAYIEVTSEVGDDALASARTMVFGIAKRRGVGIRTYISEKGSLVVHLRQKGGDKE